jgi:hypothetical protein
MVGVDPSDGGKGVAQDAGNLKEWNSSLRGKGCPCMADAVRRDDLELCVAGLLKSQFLDRVEVVLDRIRSIKHPFVLGPCFM